MTGLKKTDNVLFGKKTDFSKFAGSASGTSYSAGEFKYSL